MLSDDQVREIWSAVTAKAKGNIDPKTGQLKRGKKRLFPEMWKGYNESIRIREQVLPHVERGHFPDALFLHRAPGQSEEEADYVRKNYKQTTLNVYLDFEATISRVWGGDWSLSFPEDAPDADKAFERYVKGGVKEWSSVENFVKTAVLRPKMTDAMGVITVLPERLPIIVQEDGTEVFDTSAPLEPLPVYHTVENVWGFEYDSWYLIRLTDTVTLDDKSQGVRLLLIDDTNVWAINQRGRANDWDFTIELSYPHGVGEPPCMHLMGVPKVVDGHLIWQTPYAAPAELLDIALMGSQYLEVSKRRTNYPQRVAVGERCDYMDDEHHTRCDGGVLRWNDGTPEAPVWKTRTCPRCGGAGRYVPLGPMRDLIILPPTDVSQGDGDRINASNAINYISPSTDTMQFDRAEIEHIIRQARSILHLDAEVPMVGGDAKTATQAGLDNRSKDAFVRGIADQMFRILDLILRYTAKEMGASDEAYTLRLPITYDMRTLQDRFVEVEAAREAGMPVFVVARMMQELIAAMYDDDDAVLTALDAISRADRLMYMPQQTIATEQAAGRVQPWEAYLHYSPLTLFDAALSDLSQELDADDLAQRLADKMIELAKAASPIAEPDAASRVLGQLNL